MLGEGGNGRYMVETHSLTKIFYRRKGIPTFSTLGSDHWIHYLLVRHGSEVETVKAVDRVSLQVERGEIFGLLGPNGAGKTTLMKVLATLLIPDEGSATINGYDLVTEANQVKLNINLIGSAHWTAFDWGLSVEDNLGFFASIYGLSRRTTKVRIQEALGMVGLEDKKKEVPGKLSSGQRQKLVLAKGFLVRTPLFLLDEPTIGLDPTSAREVRNYILQKLRGEFGLTTILTTHYMQEAEDLCDRVGILDRGKLIACDTPDNLKRKVNQLMGDSEATLLIEALNANEAFIKDLSKDRNLVRITKTEGAEGTLSSTIRIHCTEPGQFETQLREKAGKHGVEIRDLRPSEPTLEDVFMYLTGKGLTPEDATNQTTHRREVG